MVTVAHFCQTCWRGGSKLCAHNLDRDLSAALAKRCSWVLHFWHSIWGCSFWTFWNGRNCVFQVIVFVIETLGPLGANVLNVGEGGGQITVLFVRIIILWMMYCWDLNYAVFALFQAFSLIAFFVDLPLFISEEKRLLHQTEIIYSM